jgi:hypothetical protein
VAAAWVLAGSTPALADQTRQHEWWLSKLNVSQAWQTSRGSGVTVAVLSDGINAAQADLSGSVTAGPDYTNSAETASTYVGLQGTPIASLIAGHGHGTSHTSGIVGVAPSARILSVRVTLDVTDPALGSSTIAAGQPDAIAAGIRYAVRHGAKVIDLPLDPGEPGATPANAPSPSTTTPPGSATLSDAAGGSSAEKAAVAYALSKKVVLVAPAGDDGAGTDATNYPAAYPGVISVGAFDDKFVKAPFSSHQPYVTLTAGGSGVEAATASGGYAAVSSTAAASAMVSGMAALIVARYPGLSPAQVTHALTSSTVFHRPGGMKVGSGHGTANAQRALAAAAALAAPPDERSGAGALPRTKPVQPAAAEVSSGGGLMPRVLRAAIVSAGVLILLLLLIAAYTAYGRRRERKNTAATTEWARSAQNAYSPYGPGDADRMLEFFAAPAGDPSASASPFGGFPTGQAPAGQFGQGQFGQGQFAGGQLPGGQLPATQLPARHAAGAGNSGTRSPAGAAGGSAGAGSGVGAWVPLGPASRAQGRQPRVSGAPPWEPAAEPDSELPWASVPGPAAARAASRAPAAESASAADSVWPTAPATPATPSVPALPSPTGRAWDDLLPGPAAEASKAAEARVAPEVRAAPGTQEAGTREAGTREAGTYQSAARESGAYQPGARERGIRQGRPASGTRASREVILPPPPPDPEPAESAEAAAPSPASSLWDAPSRPRSPSGSAWELADGEPEQQRGAEDDGGWQGNGDAYRPPATEAAAAQWGSAVGGARWEPAVTDDEPAEIDTHWLPAAAETPWPSPGQDSQWQAPASDDTASQAAVPADPAWGTTDTAGTGWQQPAPEEDTGWQPAVKDDPDWQPGGSDNGWQSPGSHARWSPGAIGSRWEAAAEPEPGDEGTGWQSAESDPSWATGGSFRSRWERDANGPGTDDAPAGDGDQVFAWRPAAQTETFPAVSDELQAGAGHRDPRS